MVLRDEVRSRKKSITGIWLHKGEITIKQEQNIFPILETHVYMNNNIYNRFRE